MKHVVKYFPLLITILLLYKKYSKIMLPKYRFNMVKRQSDFSRLQTVSEDVDAILLGNAEKIQEHLNINSNAFEKILEIMKMVDKGSNKRYELLVFLFWMASGCDYRATACFMALSCQAVRSITHKMLDYFIENMRGVIKPPSDEELEEICTKFRKRSKTQVFTHAIGAIGCCHIRIKCPENKYDEYINNENSYSIKCQAVVDSNLVFNDVFVGMAGSIDDLWIFRNSSIYQNGSYTQHNTYLLGAEGYPCQLSPVAIISPYTTPNKQQKKLNAALNRAQNVVEYAFTLLQVRWKKIFNRELDLKVSHCAKLVFAACVIHNICISVDDMGPMSEVNNIMETDLLVDDEINISDEEGDSHDGITFRNNLLEQLI